ncbi:unnamed protein product [Arctogadus glacialis]
MDRFGPSGPGAHGPAVRMSATPGDRAVKWQLCYDTAARTWWMRPDVWCIEEDRRLVPAAASETRRKTLPAVRKVMHVPLQCPAVGCHVSGDHCSANPPAVRQASGSQGPGVQDLVPGQWLWPMGRRGFKF